MNFNSELSTFQGAILSADNVHQFSRLSARGGNEDQIEYVVESLSSFLVNEHYINNGVVSKTKLPEVRKFALYMVLNGDFPVLEKLVELEDISSVIWTTPTIPKCLMCEVMWKLHMKQFIYEIISYTEPQLALQVADGFLDHFKYFNPLECLEQLKILSTACYILICRLHMLNLDPDNLSSKLVAACTNFQRCLKYFTTPPNNYKLNSLRKVELYKYQGRSLCTLFKVIDDCIYNFTTKLEVRPLNSDIYFFTYPEEYLKEDSPNISVCDSPNNILLEHLNNCNIAMLDTCKVLIMDVSVDVFCCWSEFEEKNKTMQQTVGEQCYKVREKLLKIIPLAEHPVISMFEQLARKPIEMKDTINSVDNSAIIQHISLNDDNSKAWIQALAHKEQLCQNPQLLDIVASNIEVFNQEESYKLYKTFTNHILSNSENRDYLELLSVKLFQQCSTDQKYEILEDRFDNNTFIDMEETEEFNNSMISIFNKLIVSQEDNAIDILMLFLQSPQNVFTKVFLLATENTQQTKIMLKVMNLLKKFCNHYYYNETEPCIIKITQEVLNNHLDSDAKQNNFLGFICGLKTADIISGTKLLLLIIMTNLHEALLKRNINKLSIQVNLIHQAYELQELIEYRAPMLAMLAQVLDVVRWKINSFTVNAPSTLESTLQLQTSLLKSYDGVIPENESRWLKAKLCNLHPLNMYYYRILWGPPGSTYLEVISGMTVHNRIVPNEMIACVSQVLCSCTQREWNAIWDSLSCLDEYHVLKVFHVSIGMIASAEQLNRSDETWACMLYCYRNFNHIIRYKFLKEPLSDVQVETVINMLTTMAEDVVDENIEEFGELLLPLFSYLVERNKDYNLNISELLTGKLNNTEVSSMINHLYTNGN